MQSVGPATFWQAHPRRFVDPRGFPVIVDAHRVDGLGRIGIRWDSEMRSSHGWVGGLAPERSLPRGLLCGVTFQLCLVYCARKRGVRSDFTATG